MNIEQGITLKINQQPEEMLVLGFPCGESSCWEKSSMELELTSQGHEFKLPLCEYHALLLKENARSNSL